MAYPQREPTMADPKTRAKSEAKGSRAMYMYPEATVSGATAVRPITNGRIDATVAKVRTVNPIVNEGCMHLLAQVQWFGKITVGTQADTARIKFSGCALWRIVPNKSKEITKNQEQSKGEDGGKKTREKM